MPVKYMNPFTKEVDRRLGTIPDASSVVTRHLSSLKGLFENKKAEESLLIENPIIYQVFEATENPESEGQLKYSTTVIRPGKIGDQYYMTKGHYHIKGNCGELYFGLSGEGYILMQTSDGQVNCQYVKPNFLTYVPPLWAHRAVNTGFVSFTFLAVYPADAGYNYATIEKEGFLLIAVEKEGKAVILNIDDYRKSR
ncbi:glucose-6-phosphate isomerase family protein [Chloroflexota bacterium]